MERLTPSWLTDGLIDFEYKKYMLLAYLQHAKSAFSRVELYPVLADLIVHYRNLISIKENRDLLAEQFPQQLSMESLNTFKLKYQRMVEDDAVMQEIVALIEYSIPKFRHSLDEGSFVYEHVESNCEITPIGLTSLYTNEGYLFIAQPPQTETSVYRYQVTLFDQQAGQFNAVRAIRTEHIFNAERSISQTYEALKLRLIRQYTDLPNPAVYLVVSKMKFPLNSTLVPVAKRLLVRTVSPESA